MNRHLVPDSLDIDSANRRYRELLQQPVAVRRCQKPGCFACDGGADRCVDGYTERTQCMHYGRR